MQVVRTKTSLFHYYLLHLRAVGSDRCNKIEPRLGVKPHRNVGIGLCDKFLRFFTEYIGDSNGGWFFHRGRDVDGESPVIRIGPYT